MHRVRSAFRLFLLLVAASCLAACATPIKIYDGDPVPDEQMAMIWAPQLVIREIDGKPVHTEFGFNIAPKVFVAPGKKKMDVRQVFFGAENAFEVSPELKAGRLYYLYVNEPGLGSSVGMRDLGTDFVLPEQPVLLSDPVYSKALEDAKRMGEPVSLR